MKGSGRGWGHPLRVGRPGLSPPINPPQKLAPYSKSATLARAGMHKTANFEELLVLSGLSKAELASRLGVSRYTVSRWKGKAPGPVMAYLRLYVAHKQAQG